MKTYYVLSGYWAAMTSNKGGGHSYSVSPRVFSTMDDLREAYRHRSRVAGGQGYEYEWIEANYDFDMRPIKLLLVREISPLAEGWLLRGAVVQAETEEEALALFAKWLGGG
jgi:hypothetical protein